MGWHGWKCKLAMFVRLWRVSRFRFLQIHWFSIFNSFMMVIFLVGLVSMILMRTLRKDYARYSKDEDLDDMVRTVGIGVVHLYIMTCPMLHLYIMTCLMPYTCSKHKLCSLSRKPPQQTPLQSSLINCHLILYYYSVVLYVVSQLSVASEVCWFGPCSVAGHVPSPGLGLRFG